MGSAPTSRPPPAARRGVSPAASLSSGRLLSACCRRIRPAQERERERERECGEGRNEGRGTGQHGAARPRAHLPSHPLLPHRAAPRLPSLPSAARRASPNPNPSSSTAAVRPALLLGSAALPVGSPCRAAPPSPWPPRAVVHNLRAGTPSRGTATAPVCGRLRATAPPLPSEAGTGRPGRCLRSRPWVGGADPARRRRSLLGVRASPQAGRRMRGGPPWMGQLASQPEGRLDRSGECRLDLRLQQRRTAMSWAALFLLCSTYRRHSIVSSFGFRNLSNFLQISIPLYCHYLQLARSMSLAYFFGVLLVAVGESSFLIMRKLHGSMQIEQSSLDLGSQSSTPVDPRPVHCPAQGYCNGDKNTRKLAQVARGCPGQQIMIYTQVSTTTIVIFRGWLPIATNYLHDGIHNSRLFYSRSNYVFSLSPSGQFVKDASAVCIFLPLQLCSHLISELCGHGWNGLSFLWS
ncbi:uncharacterized protein LOC120705551 isoform X3 [Panicum virgatum]|uniref:uncharacterized protein LOC120705551 isoform X3 n=1 Tax=Panicum virgatum TaxID=38727 RepID=UPI0019D541C4|nr:uncharacterized protein LOC120705551 isoform X3 [Panicum virgatum]